MYRDQACASCKHQRKRCDERCELAPYFPATRFREFQKAHRLFGVSNILKIMNAAQPHLKYVAAESILMEGNARSNDPVHGCLGIISKLKSQIEFYEKELDITNQQLAFYREKKKLEKQNQKSEDFLDASPLRSEPPLASTALQNDEFEGLNNLGSILPELPNDFVSCLKNSDDGHYSYRSTLEEGEDTKAFYIHTLDQMLEYYQHENVGANFGGPGESSSASKADGERPLQSVGEEDAEKNPGSSAKASKDDDIKDP